jgi:RHS repeat-associated protein
MKRTHRIVMGCLVLAAVALCPRSVLGQDNGNTGGGTLQPDYRTCVNLPFLPCEPCGGGNCDRAGGKTRDCNNGEKSGNSDSPTGVNFSAGESYALIDDDGPAALPSAFACPSCARTGAGIPEDSQILRVRLRRIMRSTWFGWGSFGIRMYSGYDYWVARTAVGGAPLFLFVDPNNSMQGSFLATGGGFIPVGGDDHLTKVVESTATHVSFRKLDGRLFHFEWTGYIESGVYTRARLQYIEDLNGNRINFTYLTPATNTTPDVLMWEAATDPYGRSLLFSYLTWQGNNVLGQVTLPDGRKVTYSYDEAINSFFPAKVQYGDGIESSLSYDDITKIGERNEALLEADHYRQSILLSHVAYGRTRWIKRADGTFLYSRTSSEAGDSFSSLIYHRGETTEVNNSTSKVLTSQRQQRVDGTWEDLTTYEADDQRPVKGELRPDGRHWSSVRDSANDRIVLKTYPDGTIERFTYDEFAQPTSHTHRSGAIAVWDYDARGNLRSHTEGAGMTGVEATESWSYNIRGQVEKHTDFNGNETTYDYYTNGDLKSLALPKSTGQPAGTITYSYDAAGRLASLTDPAGRPMSYGYDAAGRLIVTIYGDASTEQLNYGTGDLSARLLSQEDRNGNQTLYGYDQTGRVKTTERHEAGTNTILTTITNTWDAPTGRLMGVDRDGDSTEYSYDYKGRVLTTTVHPKKNQALTATNVYDQYHLLSTTDAYGRKTSFTYDDLDRVLATTVELTPGGATITTSNEYDAEGRQKAYIDGNGIRYEYDYDDRDRRTRERSAIGTPVLALESYSYDGNNNQLSTTDKNGKIWKKTYTSRNAVRADANPLNERTTNSYYADGLLESDTNPNGHSTTYVYDPCCGRLIEVIDADQNSKRFEYDSNGNRTRITDESGRVTAYEYDGLNRRARMIVDPAGLHLATVTDYDATPGLIGRKETSTSPAGQVVNTNYDGIARVARVDGERPPMIYTYDLIEGGFLKTTITDANSNSRSSLMDGAGRTVKTIDGLGHATVLSYDNNNNLLTVRDRDAKLTRHVYDERNRGTRTIADDGGISAATQFQYDPVGSLLRITDAEGKSTRYSYDDANRRLVATYAFGTSEAKDWNYKYFPLGQLKQFIKPNGVIIDYAYDQLERLSFREYSGATSKPGADTFTYHANGLLKRAVGGIYQTSVDRSNLVTDYDGANRLLQEREDVGAGAKAVAYSYDPDDLINEITYPGGRTMQQTYTDRRELFEVKLDAQVQASHTYDPGGRRLSRTYANGRTTQWGYDSEDRNTALNHQNVQAWDYRYTNEGDMLVQDDRTTVALGEAYAYDGMHRLIDNKRGQVVGNSVPAATFLQDWTLDKVGNWKIWNDNGTNETRTHNNHHALTSRTTVPLPQAYDGNLNQTDDGGSAFIYVYDANDQLQQVKDRRTGAVLVGYRYDAFGRRVEKSSSARWLISAEENRAAGRSLFSSLKLLSFARPNPGVKLTRYYYSGNRIIEERDSGDAVKATYTYGSYIDEPLTMDRDGNRYYYHSNRVFSTYALTDSSGQIVERYSYTPYGQVTTFDAAYQNAGLLSRVGNPFTFTGRELDTETGLMHFRARTYDTVQGRFKQRDPIGYVDGMNLYAGYFVPNALDPQGLADPDPNPPPPPPPPPVDGTNPLSNTGFDLNRLARELDDVDPEGAERLREAAKEASNEAEELGKAVAEGVASAVAGPIFKVRKAGLSGKQGAKDKPSWVKDKAPKVGESGKDYAERLMDEKYGCGGWNDRGPDSEFNKLKKYGDRAFE